MIHLTQQLAKTIFYNRYQQKFDTNFEIECNYIKKKWSEDKQNQLVIQFFIKKTLKSYLVEEWNIICEAEQVQESVPVILDGCMQLAKLSPLQNQKHHELDHLTILNEKKRSDWIDPNYIESQSYKVGVQLIVNIAYLNNLQIIEDSEHNSQNAFKEFQRERCLSQNGVKIQEDLFQMRKTSFHDADSKRQYLKNQAVLEQFKRKRSDSICKTTFYIASTSSKNQSSQYLTLVNKKDDVEILSNIEDAQKIIDEDENGDFEIQMVIEDGHQTPQEQIIIIKQITEQDKTLEELTKVKTKHHKSSSQINDIWEYFKQQ